MAKVLLRQQDGVLVSFDVNETHSGQMVGFGLARAGDDGQSFGGKQVTYRLLIAGGSVRGPYYLHKVISNEDDSIVLQYSM